jgi:dienelactone hydrolase
MKTVLKFMFLFMPAFCTAQDQKDLDPAFFDKLIGTYISSNNYEYVIGRSFVRLFLFDPQSSEYRGLYKINDTSWYAGPSLLVDSPVTKKIIFTGNCIRIEERGNNVLAVKSTAYSEKEVAFYNGQIKLAGTLLMPRGKTNCPAVVMVHGSGEQMRHGYASYIRIIADYLTKAGIAVLTFDKRGCGTSGGQWQTASFSDLAKDALAGINFLKTQAGIAKNKIGLGGSSQAGWIIAKATEINKQIGFAFCISGGGMGYTAAKQNEYNLRTELEASSIQPKLIDSVITALSKMYNYIRTNSPADAAAMDAWIRPLATNESIRGFLPALSTDMDPVKRDQWYYALEIDYDPVNAWKNYKGNLLAIFGSLDASTPVDKVVPILQKAIKHNRDKAKIITYKNTSHLILKATRKSDEELPLLKQFEPMFLPGLASWITGINKQSSLQLKKL